jgi:hypothetical protein
MPAKKSVDLRKTLQAWSDAILRCETIGVPQEMIDAKWAGEPPASAEEIAELEKRIGRKLPPSLRAFLEISNGWRFFDDGHGEPRSLFSTRDIDLLARKSPTTVDIWAGDEVDLSAAYLDDDEDDGALAPMPRAQFRKVIQISTDTDGLYFLNPLQEIEDGEWNCYFFAPWVPGESSHGTFADLVEEQYQTFLAAHGDGKSKKSSKQSKKPKLNLGSPPTDPVSDPKEFLELITKLGFFDHTDPSAAQDIGRDFLEQCAEIITEPTRMYSEFIAPGRALVRPETGRSCRLPIEATARGGMRFVMGRLRPLLAARGIEMPIVIEQKGDTDWMATLDKVEHRIARMRNGKPTGAGMQHDVNLTMVLSNAACTLANQWLRSVGAEERIASINELNGHSEPAYGLIVLSDELAYHMMWGSLLGCYCRVLRPDVL